ncbi:hypothetical protein RIF29_24212 [Crotalaria pallida]|uniref:Uncharacterized protein n=1 Tax=Crotalaria pallida TaxID=3830 RepID=A0AAN9ELS5_CROPI
MAKVVGLQKLLTHTLSLLFLVLKSNDTLLHPKRPSHNPSSSSSLISSSCYSLTSSSSSSSLQLTVQHRHQR